MLILNVVSDSLKHEFIIDAVVRNIGYFLTDGVEVMLAKLTFLPTLDESLIYASEQSLDPLLVKIQRFHFLPSDLLLQVLKCHLDLDGIGIQHIIQHGLTVDQSLPLKFALTDSLLQPFLLIEEDVLDLVVCLGDRQDLVGGMLACQIVINGEASIKAVHAHHTAAVLPMRPQCTISKGTCDFVSEGDGYLRDVAARTAFDLKLIEQSLMLFLLFEEGFDAGGTDGVPAVESHEGEEDLAAAGTSVIVASHLNQDYVWEYSSIHHGQVTIHAYIYAHMVLIYCPS